MKFKNEIQTELLASKTILDQFLEDEENLEQIEKAGGRAGTILADWELEGLRMWNRLGTVFATISQVMFVAGAVWGLIAISNIK